MAANATKPAREPHGPLGDPSKHVSFEVLDAARAKLPAAPMDSGQVSLIVRRLANGTRETLETSLLTVEEGVPGDGWTRRPPRDPDAQLAVMNRDVALLIANGQPVTLFGDNLFVTLDLSARNLPTGTRLLVGTATVEVTPLPHNGCRLFKERFGVDGLRFVQAASTRPENRRGIYWKVVASGEASVGDAVEVISRP